MVRALGWEDYPCVAGGLFILVSADGDYFRDGTEPFIAIFLGFWAIFFWPHMQKRVKAFADGLRADDPSDSPKNLASEHL